MSRPPERAVGGGIPATHASRRRVSQILYCAIPGNVGIAVPAVRHVVRRGWRESARKHGGGSAGTGRTSSRTSGTLQTPGTEKPKGAWLGYAFVAFRDAEEAAQAMLHVDGKVVRETTSDGDPVTITLSARPATIKGHRRRSRSRADAAADGGEEKTRDDADDDGRRRRRRRPNVGPAGARRGPVTLRDRARVAAVRARATRGDARVPHGGGVPGCRKAASDAKTKQKPFTTTESSKAASVADVYARSRAPIPPRLLENLRFALENTRWPAASHRRGVEAQKYPRSCLSTPRGGARRREN